MNSVYPQPKETDKTYTISNDIVRIHLPKVPKDLDFDFDLQKFSDRIIITAYHYEPDVPSSLHTKATFIPLVWEDYDELQTALAELTVWGETYLERLTSNED